MILGQAIFATWQRPVRFGDMGRQPPAHITDPATFGARVRQTRIERGVSLREAAVDVDVPTGPRARPALHRALGRAYAGMGDLSRSIAVLSAAFDDAATDPPDPALMTLFGTFLANAYTDAGLFGEAEATLSRVVRHEHDLAPGHAGVAYGLLAEVELARGNLDQARFLCRQAVELLEGTATPRYAARVWETLAEVEERAGDLEAALAALRARSTAARTP